MFFFEFFNVVFFSPHLFLHETIFKWAFKEMVSNVTQQFQPVLFKEDI